METNFRLLYLHNELSVTFGRWRQRTVREVVHVGRWTQAASGTAGRANVGFRPASTRTFRFAGEIQQPAYGLRRSSRLHLPITFIDVFVKRL